MLPGKKLTPDDVLLILRRRIWLILVPLAIVSAATAVAARRLPPRYRSETVILVVPQRVPEDYVKPTVTAKIEDRLQSISQQILSRTRLERIITDFKLYAAQRKSQVMENIVDRMRKDITVEVVKGDTFRVAYVGDDARTVMLVTQRLASLFIDENLRDREVLAEDTNQFLEAQLTDARLRLIDHEKKLEEYRQRYSGELPSQLGSNLQVIQNVQMQVQALVESTNRDRDRRLLVERQFQDAQQELEADIAAPSAVNTSSGSISQQLATARASVAEMEQRLTSDHPALQRMQRVVRDLEAKAAAESREMAASLAAGATPVSPSPAGIDRRARVADLRAQLDQIDHELASKDAEQKRLRALTDSYQARVDRIPTRESELTELTRDYSTLQNMYSTLLAKQEEAKIAANLERRQVGEQFKLLDPARIAEQPFTPNRRQIILMGVLVGLALGVGLIALLEYRDRSFKTASEVAAELRIPVLAVVSLMESNAERRRAFRRRIAVSCGLGTVVAAGFCVVIYALVT